MQPRLSSIQSFPRLVSFPRFVVASSAVLIALGTWTALHAQSAPPAPSTAVSTPSDASSQPDRQSSIWIDVRNARDRVIDDLPAAEITVYEDGQAAEVLGFGAAPEPGRVVLYFDAMLADPGTYRRGAEALAAAAGALTALGPVDLVIADPEPRLVLATDDALALGERLGWLGASDRGQGAVRAARTAALRAIRNPGAGLPAVSVREQAEIARDAADEEAAVVAAQSRRMLGWLADAGSRSARGPSILVLVADGWDLEPMRFWQDELDAATRTVLEEIPAVGRSTARDRLARVTGETARALAASEWTVWPMVATSASLARGRPSEVLDPLGDQGGLFPKVARRPQITFGGDDAKAASDEAIEARIMAPDEPLRRLADASGGQMLPTIEAVRDAAGRMRERVRLVYRSRLTADRGVRPIELRARPGVTVLGRRWGSASTPDAFLGARVDALLRGQDVDHDLDVVAAITLTTQAPADTDTEDSSASEQEGPAGARQGQLEARLSLAARDELTQRTDLRVTVARVQPGGELDLRHEVLTDQTLGEQGEWRYLRDLEITADGHELAVLIEDLNTGEWGASLASLVHGERVAVGVSSAPQTSVVEILPPEEDLLRGRVRFTARAEDPRVTSVVFELQDDEAARTTRRPFSARIDLGRTVRQQTLTAIALDTEGFELGRQSVLLNAGNGALSVEIASPLAGPASGPVDVEALVTVPLEQPLDRVLIFWNNELLATQFQAPFRQRITVPESRPMGYVRVVAMLEDGTLAEDVVFLNGPEAGERLDVDLVELYVVVTDPQGRPVRDLGQESFTVRDNGTLQEIAGFSDAGDLPITLGMAIDSSASMFVKLPRVQQAATRFLDTVLNDEDRAFVVDFDNQPRLARGTTNDLPRVVQAIDNLEASGRTALWESIVFSLVQLQGVRGRKALVVFSDGADEDDQFPFRSSLKLAKQMGVPIYMILMKKRPKRDGSGFSLWNRSFTQRASKLVEAGGGRVYYAREFASLDEVYAEIGRELRSQYLITYYPKAASRAAWREVEVEVDQRELTPRTLSGYWPP